MVQPVQPAQPRVIVTNPNPQTQQAPTYVMSQPQQIVPSGGVYMAPQQPQPRVVYAPQTNVIVNNSPPTQSIVSPQPVQQMVQIQQQPQVPLQQIQSQPIYQTAQNNDIMPSAPPESLPNANNGPLGNVNDDAPPPYRDLGEEGSNFQASSTQSYQM